MITWTSSSARLSAGGGTDAVEAAADDVQRVFGGIEQDAAGRADREAAQAGGAGGDGDGQIEGEEGFAAFGLAADDPDGLLGPQLIDQPAPLLGALGETPGRLDRKLASSPAPDRRLGLAGGGHGAYLEEQRLVDLAGLALGGGLEQLVGHDHQGAQDCPAHDRRWPR